VAKGEMSLVGSHAEMPGYSAFEGRVYRYGDQHRVKSGVPDAPQVHGLRGDSSLAERVEWDSYYIQNWSPSLDANILLGGRVANGRSRDAFAVCPTLGQQRGHPARKRDLMPAASRPIQGSATCAAESSTRALHEAQEFCNH
jgi:hypothetical protein